MSELQADSAGASYGQLLRELLATGSAEISGAVKELKIVREHASEATGIAALEAVHGRLTAVLVTFSAVHGRMQADHYIAELLPDDRLSLAEITKRNGSEALELLPDVTKQLEILWAAVSFLSDAALPPPASDFSV